MDHVGDDPGKWLDQRPEAEDAEEADEEDSPEAHPSPPNSRLRPATGTASNSYLA
jgi:hypothetical protein